MKQDLINLYLSLLLFLLRHTVGDTKVPFCLQSCVKPLKYAIAVHDHGTEYVHRFIGKEPSGLRFNKLFLDEDGELGGTHTALFLRADPAGAQN